MDLARKIFFGRYMPGNSSVHKVDARIKLLFMLALSVIIMTTSNIYHFILPALFILLVIITSRIDLWRFIYGIYPLMWLVGLTFVFHIIIPPRHLNTAALISVKLIIMFSLASILTSTTSNMDLSRSIAWIISPLKIFRISPSKTAFVLALSLRMYPLILEEAESIIKAQSIRKEKRSFVKKLESFCIVFMIRSMSRAINIENSILNSGISEDNYHVSLKQGLQTRDMLACAVLLAYIASYFFIRKIWI